MTSGQLSGLSERFSDYLFRSAADIAHDQIADMCAYVIRVYQQNALFKEAPSQGDEYLFAIRKWYHTIAERTRDFVTARGEPRQGFYFMAQGDRREWPG